MGAHHGFLADDGAQAPADLEMAEQRAREAAEQARREAARRAVESAKTATQNLGEVQVTSETAVVVCWDHGSEDGDRVDILLNGETVRRVNLTNERQSVTIRLYRGSNALEIRSLDAGSSPPNTAAFTVSAGGRTIAQKEWELAVGENAVLVVYRVD